MAPRSAAAGSKVQAVNGHAGPSRLPAQTLKSNKKRTADVVSDEEDEDFSMNGDGLDMSDDEEAEDAEEDDEDDEAFPELDSGSEADEADTESEDEQLDDEESGSESGYNSSDIDQMESDSTSVTSAEENGRELSVDEKLSRLVAKNTVKPNEAIGSDAKISTAKEGFGKLRPSKLVPGGYLREYDDIEAGYGSESSTEDVSLPRTSAAALGRPKQQADSAEPEYSWKHSNGMVRRSAAYRI
jgi:ribosome biogenesis protein ERB1